MFRRWTCMWKNWWRCPVAPALPERQLLYCGGYQLCQLPSFLPTLRRTCRSVSLLPPCAQLLALWLVSSPWVWSKSIPVSFHISPLYLIIHVDAGKTVYISRRCKEQCRCIDQPCSWSFARLLSLGLGARCVCCLGSHYRLSIRVRCLPCLGHPSRCCFASSPSHR